MGYEVTTIASDFVIWRKHWDAAFEAMAELNEHDELKTGGSWSAGKQRAVWFAWMPEDFPREAREWAETGKVEHPMIAVFEMLGFTWSVHGDEFYIDFYDSKTGAEDHFLNAVAPFVEDGCRLEWRGEDGEQWLQEFKNGEMTTRTGRVYYE